MSVGRVEAVLRLVTLVITNATKVAGVVVAVLNASGARDPLTYGVAALMMAGGQVSEEAILTLVQRFFGVVPAESSQRPAAPARERVEK